MGPVIRCVHCGGKLFDNASRDRVYTRHGDAKGRGQGAQIILHKSCGRYTEFRVEPAARAA